MKKTLCRLIIPLLFTLAATACATSTATKPESASSQTAFPQASSPRHPSGTLWGTDSAGSFSSGSPVSTGSPFSQDLLFGSGVPASPVDFLIRAQKADYILIGERHNSASHHQAQAAIITLLAENGLAPAIGLEMVPATLQSRLDRFNARETGVDDLPVLIDWANVWGFDFDLYRPVFLMAEQYNLPVYGLNVSPEVIKSIREHDTPANIPAAERKELPPVIKYPQAVQRQKLSHFFKQHASMLMARKKPETTQRKRGQEISRLSTPATTAMPLPNSVAPGSKNTVSLNSGATNASPKTSGPKKAASVSSVKRPAPNHGAKALQRFITIQSLWDSAMGYNATRIEHPGPAVILAGGAHVEYGYGIAYRIRHYEPEANILTVMPLDSPGHLRTGQADFYYLEKR